MLKVRKAIQEMKEGKAPGPSGIPIEVIEICGCEDSLSHAAHSRMDGLGTSESCRKSVLIPLYKGKGDAKECSNYRSVKLVEHSMKVIERVFERRLTRIADISGMQLEFMPGRGTIDGIFAVRQNLWKNFVLLMKNCIWFCGSGKGV